MSSVRDGCARRTLFVAILAALTSFASACESPSTQATTSIPPTPAPAEEVRATQAASPEPPSAESRETSTPAPTAEPTPESTRPPEPAEIAASATPAPTPVARLVLPPPPPAPVLPRTPGVTTVIVDPGHGGDEVGAANFGLVEKDSNLDMAFRVERLLAERGLRPLLTRRTDARAAAASAGAAPTGFSAQRIDLQARVDMANTEGAAAFISIHSNGSIAGGERGLEVYYNSQRAHAPENRRLAQLVHDSVTNELLAAGYAVTARGVKDDSCLRAFQGRCFPLFLLGPERVTTRDEILRRGGNPEALLAPGTDAVYSRATQMPAALVELLFVSNSEDAAILRSEAARQAMARGVARGVARFLGVE